MNKRILILLVGITCIAASIAFAGRPPIKIKKSAHQWAR